MQKILKPFITIEKLSIYYGKQVALKNISFTIKKGDFIGLLGPNGAGKTTLIKSIIAGIHHHKSYHQYGKIIFDKTTPCHLGYLPQQNNQIGHFPADGGEVVLIGLLANKKIPKIITHQDRQKIDAILTSLDAIHLKHRVFYSLSGGQKQLLLLARCLVAGNNFFIFDEPTTALSPKARQHFFNLISHLSQQHHATMIFITHDISEIKNHANKILYLDREIKFFGTTKKFLSQRPPSSPTNPVDCHHHP
ncbi:MAG: metal ABC transporter ATP-binding protein [Alphaproteobacteria bacterium]